LRACADRSIATMDECLGPCAADGASIEGALATAMKRAISRIDLKADTTKGTLEYVKLLEECGGALARGAMRWGDWAKLTSKGPTKKSAPHAVPVAEAAAAHLRHPRLRADMHRLTRLLFQVAADG